MGEQKNRALRGVITAIITPMNEEGDIDYGLLEKQAVYLSQAGVHGFFVGGTTAEGAYLTTGEKREIFHVVRGAAAAGQILCAAYIQPSTSAVLAEMAALRETDPDYVVAVTPYYFSMRQEDIFSHFQNIARQAPAPLILYNIPGNTHNPITLETVIELSNEKNIAGIKDSTGDFVPFSRGVLGEPREDFVWIQGEDYLSGPSLMVGCDGIVSGLSNTRAEPYVDMYKAATRQDWQAVKECQSRINRLYAIIRLCDNSIAASKAASEISGRGSRWMRHKGASLTDEQVKKIEKILVDFDNA